MPYDPSRPTSIFDPDAISGWLHDLNTMQAVRMGITPTDAELAAVHNPGAAMAALATADEKLKP